MTVSKQTAKSATTTKMTWRRAEPRRLTNDSMMGCMGASSWLELERGKREFLRRASRKRARYVVALGERVQGVGRSEIGKLWLRPRRRAAALQIRRRWRSGGRKRWSGRSAGRRNRVRLRP